MDISLLVQLYFNFDCDCMYSGMDSDQAEEQQATDVGDVVQQATVQALKEVVMYII